ncbi:four helix bundle protein [Chryseobacterium camelliae]|uniref:Four helix bundle protein n=1 Tax=Chryseobacterium camelliae TaxID=1265445 RepID=A0ABY7QKY8_9FLAO|nr:four helix bundle protein [Chryseobacterium camelliae]WBV59682.1 four helix bundle protein [Chryseobacterium camelliae]
MANFKELLVWQKSIDFVIEIYKITEAFPKTQLIIFRNLNFLKEENYQKLNQNIIEISKMLNGLINSLK